MINDKSRKEPSGPKGYPILGHIPGFLWDRLGFLSRCASEYGDVVKLKIGETTFLLNNPEDIKHVLVTNSDNFDKGPRLTSPKGKRLSGEGLLTSLGSAHLRQRMMMQPVFYRTSINAFAETITSGVEKMIAEWKNGTELNIGQDMMELAQDNIIKTVFGRRFDDPSGALASAITLRKQYVEHVQFSLLPFSEIFPPMLWHEYQQAMKRIDDTITREIDMRRGAPEPSHDLLSLLMHTKYEDGTGMTDKQIRDEFLTLFSAGYETVGEALTWTWYLLSQHPDVEARFHEELREVLGGSVPGADDLSKLRYTGMILAESMRLYPPTWIFIRMARQDAVLPSGFTIPAGSKLYLCQYVMHRNVRYWPNPERFDPERFTEHAIKARPKFTYFPFGGGIRVCIGEAFAKMECMLALASIAQRFTLTLVPGQTVVPKPHMTLRPRNGIMLRIHMRNVPEGA
ncbi:cytochrome P450 [Candidatus Nitrospira neomarina]|uniref:Cytochrome P450 n=1 Tax=Candidatus Nitrospira neomarina TaxID=3020899 RepID=A0AA96GP46_9BACT|nr:cytochrome P450 [Candidatus Nitrospira neomarina]WNM61106.1 cytochrome P450 [Candidatus Nitrospira neomarina]